MYVLDILFVVLVVAICCAYRVYSCLRWVLAWRHRKAQR